MLHDTRRVLERDTQISGLLKFTCFTSTKVQILTQMLLAGGHAKADADCHLRHGELSIFDFLRPSPEEERRGGSRPHLPPTLHPSAFAADE